MRRLPDRAVVARLKELTSLSDEEVDAVAKAGRAVKVPADWALIWEKTPADAAYYILEGAVSIRRSGEEIATLGAGDFVGELAIMNRQLRSAAVVTKTPMSVLNFSAEEVSNLAATVPAISAALSAVSAQRLGVDNGL